jgi:MFS family permease
MASAAALRSPLVRFQASAFLSSFGNGVRLAAFPLLVAGFTRSPVAVAGVTALQGLPWLLVGVVGGVLVDHIDRRRLMVTVDAVRVVILVALAVAVVTHSAGLVLIYLTAFATGTASALRDIAAETAVPRLVGSADLEAANGRMIGSQIVGNELAGPAAGAWLFGIAAVLPFAVNAGALGIAAVLLMTLPSVFQPPPRAVAASAEAGFAAFRRDIRDGFSWLRHHRDMRELAIITGVVCITDSAWFAILVLYVIQELHQPAAVYGLLLAVAALGGIAAAGVGGRLAGRWGAQRSLIITGFAMAATQIGLGLTGNVVVAAVMLAASSGAFAVFNLTAVTLRQRRVPAELLGRVTAINGTIAQSSEAVGAIIGGVLAASAGVRAPLFAGAAPMVAMSALLTWRARRPHVAV